MVGHGESECALAGSFCSGRLRAVAWLEKVLPSHHLGLSLPPTLSGKFPSPSRFFFPSLAFLRSNFERRGLSLALTARRHFAAMFPGPDTVAQSPVRDVFAPTTLHAAASSHTPLVQAPHSAGPGLCVATVSQGPDVHDALALD